MSPSNHATEAQNRAADPGQSTWVSANAGSGKTRVLTDRVARLLLHRVPPQKILCLTYTKAAASHMQNQLFARLGSWVMLPDDKLRETLIALGESHEGISAEDLRIARTLFAAALETPGGLKIQTIHSFCASLLRRFPLEAGVSPQFQEMDDRSGRVLRADILDHLADQADATAFDGMAAYLTGENTEKLTQEITKHRDAFMPARTEKDIWQLFGLRRGYDEESYLSEVFPVGSGDLLKTLKQALEGGSINDQKAAAKIAKLDTASLGMGAAEVLEGIFLFGSTAKNPNAAKIGTFPTKDTRDLLAGSMDEINQLMSLFEQARPTRLSLKAAQKTWALHRFACAFLPEYAARKQMRGWLDFDDLILKARNLLTRSGMAQWVLFKMDGGIDHILVDEAQDTSPEQWDVIAALAEEFHAGLGARDAERTLFIVGDEKQSIYSFQGADPLAFERMRQHFDSRLTEAGSNLWQRDLLYSFRSSAAVLDLVDRVMEGAGQDIPTKTLHRAFHDQLPGRVDLWPFIPTPEKPEKPDWFEPVDTPALNDPMVDLANRIAGHIKSLIDSGQSLDTTKGPRKVSAGDFLILVQRRSALFHLIIKALKTAGLPVAGADRMKIGANLAVRDLTALLAFLETPEDDLALACALRSPLFGISEQDLFTISHGRKGWLWAHLRALDADYADVVSTLKDLRNQADFLRPYELLERVLTRHDGRSRLKARLGPEAEEGIDALLSQALDYEQMEPPTLTGFLGWMSTDDSDLKRQMDTHATEIRVMTVHGAKGLEAPIVILPDTAKRDIRIDNNLIPLATGAIAWKPLADDSPPLVQDAVQALRQAQAEERLRLLYVAMTRAENWLIVCGAGEAGKDLDSWYNRIAAACETLPTLPLDVGFGAGKRYQSENWKDVEIDGVDCDATPQPALPDWVSTPAPTVERPMAPLSPSDLEGAKVVTGAGAGLDQEAAMLRGTYVHLLLEHLPSVSPEAREELAKRLLPGTVEPADFEDILNEAISVLTKSDLDFLFKPDVLAEVSLSFDIDGIPYLGVIDRLVVLPDRILAIDFKTNAVVPERPQDIPEGILRQMAAYHAGLSQLWMDRNIEVAILWTRTAEMMVLPHDIVTNTRAIPTIS
jgi:ATP-dependent helicase/nuclease subunit A